MPNSPAWIPKRWWFRGVALFLACFGLQNAISQEARSWKVKPSYESPLPAAGSNAFSISDSNGVQHVLYSDSHAILVIEGAYRRGGWTPVSDAAAKNEKLVRESLEERGFHVMVWRDLASSELKIALDEAFSNFGYKQNTRLFFYYYGHGKLMDDDLDGRGARTFLVPVDAPDPSKDEEGFYRMALPITQIVEYSKQMTVKHAFFAFEACRAGSVIASLGGLEPLNPKGYLLSKEILRPIRYFLTAGTADQDVSAVSPFTPLLVAAMYKGDSNHDGYVTGSEMINYVTQVVPQYTSAQNPEHGSIPPSGGGDIVMGLSDPHGQLPEAPVPIVTKTEVVTRDWNLPGLNVGCNRTNSGRVEASVALDPRLEEKVISVTASLRDTINIKDQTGPTIEGPPGPKVVVKYGFNGLDTDLIGNCPGGGHATLVVTFTIERKVEVPPK